MTCCISQRRTYSTRNRIKKHYRKYHFFCHEEKTLNDLLEALDALSFLCDEKTQEDLPVGLYHILYRKAQCVDEGSDSPQSINEKTTTCDRVDMENNNGLSYSEYFMRIGANENIIKLFLTYDAVSDLMHN